MLWLRSFRKECTLFILPRLDVPTFSYELRIARSTSGDQHPMHLYRYAFEISRASKKKMSGLFKDVVSVMPLDCVAVDFVADTPGDTIIHCHQQLHMDYGFMQLISYSR